MVYYTYRQRLDQIRNYDNVLSADDVGAQASRLLPLAAAAMTGGVIGLPDGREGREGRS